MKLCQKVLDGKFKPTYYKERKIKERSKERIIKPPTFECKVVQKVLCDMIIRCIFERRMISTNYASVRGRGTEKLYQGILSGVNKCARLNQNAVIVMTDFSGYFASINNRILEKIFSRYIKDSRIVTLIRSFASDQYGLSLGNETSQIPASFFPSPIDHYFKDQLGLQEYYRYMDDCLFVADSWYQACIYVDEFKKMAEALDLVVKEEKIVFMPIGEDFIFCKERYIFNKEKGYYYRLMNPAIPRNEIRKLKAFGKKLITGEITQEEIKAQYLSVIGMIKKKPNAKRIANRLDERYYRIRGAGK